MLSVRKRRDLNVCLIKELTTITEHIRTKKNFLPKYWYILKYYIHSCHAIYRLLFKIICVYAKYMSSKTISHYLVHGPRTIKENIKIFEELTYFISIQLAHIYAIIMHKLDGKMQDQIYKLLHRLVKFLDTVQWVDDASSKYTRNGISVKYDCI